MRAWLEQRFFLRIHMTLILGGTFLAGLVTTRLLMDAGVNRLALRYMLSVAAAYFVFVVLIRLWLSYVGSGGEGFDFCVEDAIDGAERAISAPRFEGGGSSGSWGNLDVGGDLEDIVVIVLLLVFLILLCGVAIYFIYTAPALLSEAAFEAALAASLVKQTKKAAACGWMTSVFRATAFPFFVVLVFSGALGWFAQKRCPDAKRLREAISCAKPSPQPPEVARQSQ